MTNIIDAAKIIRSGEVVAFPTETVYGLGADATNNEACLKIYALKGRPNNNPLIVHVSSIEEARLIGEFNPLANQIIKNFWPGPLTIVLKLKQSSNICNVVTAGLGTIGIRMPAHPKALQLIASAGVPIAAPSANISNYVSPTETSHVREAFGDKIHIIEGDKSIYGLESTIIDVSNNIPTILRHGFITQDAIESVIGETVNINNQDKILAPGMMKKHYSPKAKLRINAENISDNEIFIGFGNVDFGELNLSRSGDLAEAASNLYSMIRQCDTYEDQELCIAVAPVPNIGIGIAINDRLRRAASDL